MSSSRMNHPSPATKRRRLAEDEEAEEAEEASVLDEGRVSLLQSLPEELFLRVLTYVERCDAVVVACVSRGLSRAVMDSAELWKELALRDNNNNGALEDAARSLRGQVVCASNSKTNDQVLVPLSDAALWRRLWASREQALQKVLVEGKDYHLVTERGLPAYVDEEFAPHWMALSTYSFAIHVWGIDGIKRTQRCVLAPFGGNSDFRLEVGDRSGEFGSILHSGEFHALEIELVTDESSVVLYSSLNPLEAYGGGTFEEYAAMPWFEKEGEDCDAAYFPERFDWLPFVVVDIPDTNYMVINVKLQWCSKGPTGKRGDDYQFIGLMNRTEILTFLKHRVRRGESVSSIREDPHCFVQSVPPILPSQDYQPKPLSSYSFIIDVKHLNNPAKKCSIFCERPSDYSMDEYMVTLNFDIPTLYDDVFPYAEDYESQTNSPQVRWIEIDTIISVFVVDRHTGMQAKLYESNLDCAVWEYLDLRHFYGFEKCATLTQFSNGVNASTIPVPTTHGFLHSAWKDYEPPGTLRYLSIHFGFSNYQPGSPGTGSAIEMTEFSIMDALTFLDKGLAYK